MRVDKDEHGGNLQSTSTLFYLAHIQVQLSLNILHQSLLFSCLRYYVIAKILKPTREWGLRFCSAVIFLANIHPHKPMF